VKVIDPANSDLEKLAENVRAGGRG